MKLVPCVVETCMLIIIMKYSQCHDRTSVRSENLSRHSSARDESDYADSASGAVPAQYSRVPRSKTGAGLKRSEFRLHI